MKLKCIHHQNPPLAGLSNWKHKQAQLNTHCFSTHHAPSGGVVQWHSFCLPNTVTTKTTAIVSSRLAVLGVDSPPAAATGDLKVLILTSAAFLFLYWIANFVVPEIIMKDLQSDDASNDQQPKEEGGIASSKTISSGTKKKGFQGTK